MKVCRVSTWKPRLPLALDFCVLMSADSRSTRQWLPAGVGLKALTEQGLGFGQPSVNAKKLRPVAASPCNKRSQPILSNSVIPKWWNEHLILTSDCLKPNIPNITMHLKRKKTRATFFTECGKSDCLLVRYVILFQGCHSQGW